MLYIVFRILITLLLAYYFSRVILKLIRGSKNDIHFKDSKKTKDIPKDDVIDLCPKCGQVLKFNHKCKKISLYFIFARVVVNFK